MKTIPVEWTRSQKLRDEWHKLVTARRVARWREKQLTAKTRNAKGKGKLGLRPQPETQKTQKRARPVK